LLGTFAVVVAAAPGTVSDPSLPKNRIMNCPVDADDFGEDCESIDYAIRAVVWIIPPALIALFLGFFSFFFCCGRICCGCCGGKDPSSGCCCPGGDPEYSKWDYRRPKLFIFLWMIVAVLGTLLGLVGAISLTVGLSDFAGASGNLGGEVNRELDGISVAMTVARYHDTNNTYYQENLFVGTSLEASGRGLADSLNALFSGDNVKAFQQRVSQAQVGIFILIILPTVLCVIGTVAGIAGVRTCVPMLLVALLFFVGFWIWLMNGVFGGMELMFTDVCAEFNGVAEQQRNLTPLMLVCDEAMFSDFQSSFQESMDREALRACTGLLSTCYFSNQTLTQNIDAGRVNSCPAILDDYQECLTRTFGQLLELADSDFITHPAILGRGTAVAEGLKCRNSGGACSVLQCASDCTLADGSLSQVGRSSLKIVVDLNAAVAVGNAMDGLGSKFSSCNTAFGVVITPFLDDCDNLIQGANFLRIATGFAGVAIIGALYSLTWGSKRFSEFQDAREQVAT